MTDTPITTDYTTKSTQDTLMPGTTQAYRLLHWLTDILKNFFADPVNILDERISSLLRLQDGDNEETLNALFKIGTPYTGDMKKAGTTPVVIVSIGDTTYPVQHMNKLAGKITGTCGSISAYSGMRYKHLGMMVSIATESYDGTVLLAGLIEDFLIMNEVNMISGNGSISEFHVKGVSAPQEIAAATSGNAKQIFQASISIGVVGGIGWTTDTQGPTYRGTHIRSSMV